MVPDSQGHNGEGWGALSDGLDSSEMSEGVERSSDGSSARCAQLYT